jgi:hypothetical protein
MLFFLRRKRKEEMIKKRVSRYLLYAIGEILLVVVGILIAIRIENWNQDQQERKLEIRYLENLKIDLSNDLIQLDYMIEVRQNKSNAALRLLSLSRGNTEITVEEFDKLIATTFLWQEFTPSRNTYDELIHSGNFSIISSDSIKARLLDLKYLYDRAAQGKDHMRNIYDEYLYKTYYAIVSNHTLLDIDQLQTTDQIFIEENKSLLLSEISEILNNHAFTNGLQLAAANNRAMTKGYEFIRKEIKEILRMINEDIEA